jgi:nitrite reductase/ring-hydroxylating ferredoxin subunit
MVLMNEAWITVALLPQVPEGRTLLVDVAGEAVCLYNLNGVIFATQNECTHAEASLAEGYIEDDCIECPLHQATFHIPTGKVRNPPATEDLRVYAVKVHGNEIRVLLASSE